MWVPVAAWHRRQLRAEHHCTEGGEPLQDEDLPEEDDCDSDREAVLHLCAKCVSYLQIYRWFLS